MKTEKEKLQAKTVDQLKRYAKKVGAKIVTPEGKAKTKDQLVNSIVMKERLSGKTLGAKPAAKKQTGKSNIAKDKARKALSPGQRVSAKGKKYYEYRRNRSDVPGQMLGQKIQDYRGIPNLRVFEVVYLGPSNTSGTRVKINDLRFQESKTIPYNYKADGIGGVATLYLNDLGIKIDAKGESQKGTFLFTKNFEKSIKDKA